MSGYFRFFPKINYPLEGKLIDGDRATYVNTSDIMIRYKIREKVLNNDLSYYIYEWKDEDRPDTVANAYYGSPEYAWIVCFSGEVFDWLYDLPVPQRQFQAYLEKKYGVDNALTLQNQTSHYEDGKGFVVDMETFNSLPADSGKKQVTIWDAELEKNENRRNVKLLNRSFLQQIVNEFKDRMEEIKDERDNSNLQQIISS